MDDFNIHIFETYLAGQLSESDKLEFESRLISDQAFAKDFESFKILQAGIRLQAMQNRLATLKANINKDADKDDVIKPILNRNYWTWSLVSILVLSVLGYIIYTQTLPVSKQINVKQDQVINLDSLDQKASSKGQQSETLPAVDSAGTFNKVIKHKKSKYINFFLLFTYYLFLNIFIYLVFLRLLDCCEQNRNLWWSRAESRSCPEILFLLYQNHL